MSEMTPERLREIADRMSDSYAEMSDIHIEWLRGWADWLDAQPADTRGDNAENAMSDEGPRWHGVAERAGTDVRIVLFHDSSLEKWPMNVEHATDLRDVLSTAIEIAVARVPVSVLGADTPRDAK